MNRKTNSLLIKILFLFYAIVIVSCTSPSDEKAEILFKTQCARCHELPDINALPKKIWKTGVLPEMAALMGLIDNSNDPYKSHSVSEQIAMRQTGIYPNQPQLSLQDWTLLKDYIIRMAPDSLEAEGTIQNPSELIQFTSKQINIDSTLGSYITFLKYNQSNNTILLADTSGKLLEYNAMENSIKTILQKSTPITDYFKADEIELVTLVGILHPSEIKKGNIDIHSKNKIEQLPFTLHRPVNTLVKDLNNNGQKEIVVSEFGHLTGSLSLLYTVTGLNRQKKTLLNQPGTIRTIAKDMNNDGKLDLVTLASQGRESITILYQQDSLEFNADPVIKFSPVYGTSWFELLDYDGDGDDDIITAHGDNADKSFVPKPYHGLRIYINDGENKFEEKYFCPINGATRLVAHDFDQDGDIDFGVLSTFPDYQKKPEFSFLYLENINSKDFHFKPFTTKNTTQGKWLLMDTGDFNSDGDLDIVLSSFTYAFNKTPDSLMNYWLKSDVDIMILDNTTIP
ncbi:VCBS repeat-containing protein [Aurantibacter crassamenti]|uniref:FG-GAP repeat domain-containing protein n=1 Tax=Aurantibacter crassamenti TaxID=1837375 RepID=UPI00193A6272|nr:VCBS repeat-containing protein [Aurantibacter crassamenti]MBM1106729.1 VCBS repeat-containing protein [Aurantibacter crassamenti]